MPPKKNKSGGQIPVTFVPTKMSTRYGGKKTVITPEIKPSLLKTPSVKPASRAPARKTKIPRARGKKTLSKEIEVNLDDPPKGDDIEAMLSELEKDDSQMTTAPIEQVFLEMDEEFTVMEANEADSSEAETFKITEQLENLNVESGEQLCEEELCEEELCKEDKIEVEEQPDVIDIDAAEDLEYVTEEFVPVAENTEVITIDEDSAPLNDALKAEDKTPEVIASPLADLVEELKETVDEDVVERLKEESVEPEAVVTNDDAEMLAKEEAEEIPKQESEREAEVEEKQEVNTAVCQDEEILAKTEKPPGKTEKPKTKKKQTKKEPRKTAPKTKSAPKANKKEAVSKTEEVRRSSRIKSISVSKQRSKGHGLVKANKSPKIEESTLKMENEKERTDATSAFAKNEVDNKPVKVKSRWRRSCELEMNVLTPAAVKDVCGEKLTDASNLVEEKDKSVLDKEEVESRLKQFVHLKENLYLTDRMTCKEAKKMTCDCFLTEEEIESKEWGCGEDCLNRLLMIECGSFCPIGDRCTNKKFQKTQFAPVEVFKTEKKGLGLRAAANIPYGEFILEYVGEVLDPAEFDSRADDYSNDKNRHYYFMSLRADAIIDATMKGNISRFINHSCDPNAETQKWTVNGELRIGFFSTRTILAGEEITFDYRFQRYGKEAQKCYCEASICRGWLGEEPEDDEDEYEEDDDEEEAAEMKEQLKDKIEAQTDEISEKTETETAEKQEITLVEKPPEKEKKKRTPRKKQRKEIYEDLDQLVEEIEMLVTTGLKNQAHTLKLSRLMVRAKEPTQRAKLLRVLRRGELPCRRLFLDYHGLRLMHGYMTDAQTLVKNDNKFESLRLELLQTLATLPIPNKTMLQDSKVLPTVERWSTAKANDLDSDGSSPLTDQEPVQPATEPETPKEAPQTPIEEDDEEIRKSFGMDNKGRIESSFSHSHGKELADEISGSFQEDMDTDVKPDKPETCKADEPNYEEEIIALALKLLEEWANLKEVFKIPKKERIEQMKEHEREANRVYNAGLGLEQDVDKKNEQRYRILKRYRSLDKGEVIVRKNIKLDERNTNNFPKMGKFERRKMFALQVEQREEERRRKQREMWRQHEQHCILLGTDPRLTAPYDPNRGYQCIWNPQIGQWQNYPIQNQNIVFSPQNPALMAGLPAANPGFPYLQPNLGGMMPGPVNPIPLPTLPYQEEAKKEDDLSQVKFMGPIPPPVKLPPKWKCAKDKYGRPYYYHIKIRKSQWEPPPFSQPQPLPQEEEESSETSSSSDTSSLSSDTSSEESDSDDDLDDSKLILQVRKQVEKQMKIQAIQHAAKNEVEDSPSQEKVEEMDDKDETDSQMEESMDDSQTKDFSKEENSQSTSKKRRAGLVHEIIISPRTEEDRLQFREDLKRYKMNKEKLKKEKELILQQSKKRSKEKRHKTIIKLKMKEMNDSNTEAAKRIRESFRSTMATVVVSVLNAHRKPDCKEGRITNTEDFKHLARKLTHFVMLKEMKHIDKIEELVCTENVKSKAKEYIRKYMSKFGETYQKRNDEPDF